MARRSEGGTRIGGAEAPIAGAKHVLACGSKGGVGAP
jgi:hypothetical protein